MAQLFTHYLRTKNPRSQVRAAELARPRAPYLSERELLRLDQLEISTDWFDEFG